MATTTEIELREPDRARRARPGAVRGACTGIRRRRCSTTTRCCAARGSSRRAAPLVVDTGVHTGRSPNDKFVVREPGSEDRIAWGSVNQPIDEEQVRRASRARSSSFLEEQDLYVVDAFAGADPAHRLALRVVTYSPWHALFAKTLFIDPTEEEIAVHVPEALVLHAPPVEADPDEDGTRSGTFVLPAPVAPRGADRRDVLRGRDQEVDLHAHERPPAASRRAADALLGERRRGRTRRGVLRPLGHRQDDAVRRPRAAPDRRRRARLVGRRRLQRRGWLLREGRFASRRRPSRRSTGRRTRSARCSRTSS